MSFLVQQLVSWADCIETSLKIFFFVIEKSLEIVMLAECFKC